MEEQRVPQTDDPSAGQQQPGPYSQQSTSSGPSSSSSADYVTRSEFEDRMGKLEKSSDDKVTVTAPQPDPEITPATAAAIGQPDPNLYGGENNPPEGSVDPLGRSDGTGLATEGNEPVAGQHREGFFRGW